MSIASASRSALGKRRGSKNWSRFDVRGKHGGVESESSRWAAAAPVSACRADGTQWSSRDTTHAEGSREPAAVFFLLLPPCFPGFRIRVGEAKNGPDDDSKYLIFLRDFGAGEAIRTPDPNLGKVMLYP